MIDESCMRSVRPGFGLAPKFYDELMGKKVLTDIQTNTATSWDVLER